MQTLLDAFKEWEPFGQGFMLLVLLAAAFLLTILGGMWLHDMLSMIVRAFTPAEPANPEEVRLNHEYEMEQERTTRIKDVLNLLEDDRIVVSEAERLIKAVNGGSPGEPIDQTTLYELDKLRGKPA